MSFWNIGASSLLDTAADVAFGNRAWNQQKDFTREQMAWQERMANTAYQRAAKDLEAAGLNRVLALGSPGSTPGIPSASRTPAKSSIVASALNAQQLATAKEATRLTGNEADIKGAEAAIAKWKAKKYLAAEPYVDEAMKHITSGNPWKLIEMLWNGTINTAKDAKKGISELENSEISKQIREQSMHKLKEYRDKMNRTSGGLGKPGERYLDITY